MPVIFFLEDISMKVTIKTILLLGAMLFVVTQVAYAPALPVEEAPEIPAGLAPYFLVGLTSGAFLIRRFFNRKDS